MVETSIPNLVRAALTNNTVEVRSLVIRIIRKVKNDYPEVSKELSEILDFHGIGLNPIRSISLQEIPIDNDSRLSLVDIESNTSIEKPIFSKSINKRVEEFIYEIQKSKELINQGLLPPSSLLLHGSPGVGKTLLAKYIASELRLNLITINIASIISSLLGKTGQNIKSIFDYARNEPCVLFLDEFDAIAKKRNDETDIGELKRIVNVLLKELENLPIGSIVIAATNHPEMLDKAIWRRFDSSIEIGLPDISARNIILKKELEGFKLESNHLDTIAELINNTTPADITKMVNKIKRKVVVYQLNILDAIVRELPFIVNDPTVDFYKQYCKFARTLANIPLSELGTILGKSKSTIQYYLK